MSVPGASTEASALRVAGFEYRRVDVEGVTVNCAVAGSGAPLLLLHGYPENHLMWRQVAPVLARDHTVVLADLRGYGDSGKPAPDAAGLVDAYRPLVTDVGADIVSVQVMSEDPMATIEMIGKEVLPALRAA